MGFYRHSHDRYSAQSVFKKYNNAEEKYTYLHYAELGRVPLDLHIKMRMVNYWISLVNGNSNKIARKVYDIMLAEHDRGKPYKWIGYVKGILASVGMPDLINQQSITNPKALKTKISKTLNDLYVQEWFSKLDLSSKGRDYSIYKQDPSFEPYLKILNKNAYLPMIKFRTSNYKLPIETGRWENRPINDRKCTLCDKNDIGDSFHYLLICPFFKADRIKLLHPYYHAKPNIIKYKNLLSSTNKNVLLKLSKFIRTIMIKFH